MPVIPYATAYVSNSIIQQLTSYLAPFSRYGGLLVKFSLLTEAAFLQCTDWCVVPKSRTAKFRVKKLETSLYRTV